MGCYKIKKSINHFISAVTHIKRNERTRKRLQTKRRKSLLHYESVSVIELDSFLQVDMKPQLKPWCCLARIVASAQARVWRRRGFIQLSAAQTRAQSVWIDRSSTTPVLADPSHACPSYTQPFVRIDYRQPTEPRLSDVTATDVAADNWLAGVTEHHISPVAPPTHRHALCSQTTSSSHKHTHSLIEKSNHLRRSLFFPICFHLLDKRNLG